MTSDGHPEAFGPFQVEEEIGRGGMGIVYRARHPLHGTVALKVLAGAHDPDARTRFLRAARVAAQLKHPGIVEIRATGEEGGTPYVAMALVEGDPLGTWGRTHRGDAAALSEILDALADALACAHEAGVIHRDLKPANILVERGSGRPMLLDFGLARSAGTGSTGVTRAGAALGTAPYMAPEQVAGRGGEIDGRTDLYGLGAVAYEMLTGVPPHGGTSEAQVFMSVLSGNLVPPRRLRPGVPEGIEAIVMRLLSHRPRDRYPDASALREDLSAFREGRPVAALARARAERGRRRLGPLAALAAGGALAALLDASWTRWGIPRLPDPPAPRGSTGAGTGAHLAAQRLYMDGRYDEAREAFDRLARAASGADARRLSYQAALCVLRPSQGIPSPTALRDARARLEGIRPEGTDADLSHRVHFWLAVIELYEGDLAAFESRLASLSAPGAWQEILAWVPRDVGLRAAEEFALRVAPDDAPDAGSLDAMEEAARRFEGLREHARAAGVRLRMSQVALRRGECTRALACAQQASSLAGDREEVAAAAAYQEARVFAALGNLGQADEILRSPRVTLRIPPLPARPHIPERLPTETQDAYQTRLSDWAAQNALALTSYREAERRKREARTLGLKRDALRIQVLAARGDLPGALEVAQRILGDPDLAQVDPGLHAEALLRRAEVLQQASPPEALAALEDVLAFAQARETQAQAALAIGLTRWLMDDLGSAEADLTRALEGYPEQAGVAARARLARGFVRYAAGAAREGEEDWRAVEDAPAAWPDTLVPAAARILLGETPAGDVGQEALAGIPFEDRNDLLFWASCRSWMEGDEARAIGMLNQALEANPLHDWPHPILRRWTQDLAAGRPPTIPRLPAAPERQ